MDNFTLLAFIAPIVAIAIIPVSTTIKVILVIIFLALMFYFKRGYFYLVLGTNIINNGKGDRQRGWEFFKKGWRAGLSDSSALVVANLFANHKDPSVALKIYDSILKKKESKVREEAKTGKALSLWALDNKEEAVDILRLLFDRGQISKNAALYLSSYLINLGYLDEAYTVVEKSLKIIPKSYKLLDLKAYLLYLRGSVNSANELYEQLFNERIYKFPEIYFHAAEVAISLNEEIKAKNYLNEALNFPFLKTSALKREEVEGLLNSVTESLDSDGSLVFDFYDDEDLFADEPTSVEEEYLEIELNTLLDPDDYYYDEEYGDDLDLDDQPSLESSLFEDEYEDDEQELGF